MEAGDFNGGSSRFIARVLRALPVADTEAFFRGLGVSLREERRGKLFPESNRARDVLDGLTSACRDAGVRFLTSTRVTAARQTSGAFAIETSGGPVSASTLGTRHWRAFSAADRQ